MSFPLAGSHGLWVLAFSSPRSRTGITQGVLVFENKIDEVLHVERIDVAVAIHIANVKRAIWFITQRVLILEDKFHQKLDIQRIDAAVAGDISDSIHITARLITAIA